MPKTKPLPDLCQYDEAECAPKPKASKDKRHWCRGKVGVRHKVRWEIRDEGFGKKELICVACGKHLDWYYKPWRNIAIRNSDTNPESEVKYAKRCAKAWENKQADTKRRLAYYLDFVE